MTTPQPEKLHTAMKQLAPEKADVVMTRYRKVQEGIHDALFGEDAVPDKREKAEMASSSLQELSTKIVDATFLTEVENKAELVDDLDMELGAIADTLGIYSVKVIAERAELEKEATDYFEKVVAQLNTYGLYFKADRCVEQYFKRGAHARMPLEKIRNFFQDGLPSPTGISAEGKEYLRRKCKEDFSQILLLLINGRDHEATRKLNGVREKIGLIASINSDLKPKLLEQFKALKPLQSAYSKTARAVEALNKSKDYVDPRDYSRAILDYSLSYEKLLEGAKPLIELQEDFVNVGDIDPDVRRELLNAQMRYDLKLQTILFKAETYSTMEDVPIMVDDSQLLNLGTKTSPSMGNFNPPIDLGVFGNQSKVRGVVQKGAQHLHLGLKEIAVKKTRVATEKNDLNLTMSMKAYDVLVQRAKATTLMQKSKMYRLTGKEEYKEGHDEAQAMMMSMVESNTALTLDAAFEADDVTDSKLEDAVRGSCTAAISMFGDVENASVTDTYEALEKNNNLLYYLDSLRRGAGARPRREVVDSLMALQHVAPFELSGLEKKAPNVYKAFLSILDEYTKQAQQKAEEIVSENRIPMEFGRDMQALGKGLGRMSQSLISLVPQPEDDHGLYSPEHSFIPSKWLEPFQEEAAEFKNTKEYLKIKNFDLLTDIERLEKLDNGMVPGLTKQIAQLRNQLKAQREILKKVDEITEVIADLEADSMYAGETVLGVAKFLGKLAIAVASIYVGMGGWTAELCLVSQMAVMSTISTLSYAAADSAIEQRLDAFDPKALFMSWSTTFVLSVGAGVAAKPIGKVLAKTIFNPAHARLAAIEVNESSNVVSKLWQRVWQGVGRRGVERSSQQVLLGGAKLGFGQQFFDMLFLEGLHATGAAVAPHNELIGFGFMLLAGIHRTVGEFPINGKVVFGKHTTGEITKSGLKLEYTKGHPEEIEVVMRRTGLSEETIASFKKTGELNAEQGSFHLSINPTTEPASMRRASARRPLRKAMEATGAKFHEGSEGENGRYQYEGNPEKLRRALEGEYFVEVRENGDVVARDVHGNETLFEFAHKEAGLEIASLRKRGVEFNERGEPMIERAEDIAGVLQGLRKMKFAVKESENGMQVEKPGKDPVEIRFDKAAASEMVKGVEEGLNVLEKIAAEMGGDNAFSKILGELRGRGTSLRKLMHLTSKAVAAKLRVAIKKLGIDFSMEPSRQPQGSVSFGVLKWIAIIGVVGVVAPGAITAGLQHIGPYWTFAGLTAIGGVSVLAYRHNTRSVRAAEATVKQEKRAGSIAAIRGQIEAIRAEIGRRSPTEDQSSQLAMLKDRLSALSSDTSIRAKSSPEVEVSNSRVGDIEWETVILPEKAPKFEDLVNELGITGLPPVDSVYNARSNFEKFHERLRTWAGSQEFPEGEGKVFCRNLEKAYYLELVKEVFMQKAFEESLTPEFRDNFLAARRQLFLGSNSNGFLFGPKALKAPSGFRDLMNAKSEGIEVMGEHMEKEGFSWNERRKVRSAFSKAMGKLRVTERQPTQIEMDILDAKIAFQQKVAAKAKTTRSRLIAKRDGVSTRSARALTKAETTFNQLENKANRGETLTKAETKAKDNALEKRNRLASRDVEGAQELTPAEQLELEIANQEIEFLRALTKRRNNLKEGVKKYTNRVIKIVGALQLSPRMRKALLIGLTTALAVGGSGYGVYRLFNSINRQFGAPDSGGAAAATQPEEADERASEEDKEIVSTGADATARAIELGVETMKDEYLTTKEDISSINTLLKNSGLSAPKKDILSERRTGLMRNLRELKAKLITNGIIDPDKLSRAVIESPSPQPPQAQPLPQAAARPLPQAQPKAAEPMGGMEDFK